MAILHYGNTSYEADKIAKTESEVILYDKNNHELMHLYNVVGDEWNSLIIENGEWTTPENIPSEIETMRADVDYLLMLSEM